MGSHSLLQGIFLTQDQTKASHISERFFTALATREAQNVVPDCSLKNDRMILVCFQDTPFNITAMQIYSPTTNVEEAEVELIYECLKDLLELTPKKDILSIRGNWE